MKRVKGQFREEGDPGQGDKPALFLPTKMGHRRVPEAGLPTSSTDALEGVFESSAGWLVNMKRTVC
jgi:hypothetical protein